MKLVYANEPNYEKLSGGVRMFDIPNNLLSFNKSKVYSDWGFDGITYVKDFMKDFECDEIIKLFESYGNYSPVTIQGLQDVTDDNVGSNRITGFCPELSTLIFNNLFLNTAVANNKVCISSTPTDWWQGDDRSKFWTFAGVSPMLRFMKYEQGGSHYPHYDAGFIYPESDYRTLKSFVLYLTTNQSGSTRIIDDCQLGTAIWYRDHSDWHREAYDEEVICEFLPVKGDMLIFDHKICHDVSKFIDPVGDRIIIRGDLIYKKD